MPLKIMCDNVFQNPDVVVWILNGSDPIGNPYHLKTQPLFAHSKSRLIRISGPHFTLKLNKHSSSKKLVTMLGRRSDKIFKVQGSLKSLTVRLGNLVDAPSASNELSVCVALVSIESLFFVPSASIESSSFVPPSSIDPFASEFTTLAAMTCGFDEGRTVE